MGEAAGTAIIGGIGTIAGSLIGAHGSSKAASAEQKAAGAATQAQLEMYYQSREDLAPWLKAGKWALGKRGVEPFSAEKLKKLRQKRNALRKELGGVKKSEPKQLENRLRQIGDNVPERRIMEPQARGDEERNMWWYNQNKEADREEEIRNEIKRLNRKIRLGKTGREGTGLVGMIERGPGEFVPEETPGYKYGYEEFIEKPLLRGAAARGRYFSPGTTEELGRRASDYAETSYDNFLSRYYQSLTPYQSLAGVGQTAAGTMGGLAPNLSQNYLYGGQAAGYGAIGQANALMGGISGLSNILSNYWANKNLYNAPELTQRQKLLGV